MASNDGMFLDYIISEHYFVKRIRLQQNLKSCLFDLNLPLTEFVGNKSSVSPLIKPFFTLTGGGAKRNVCIGTFLQL